MKSLRALRPFDWFAALNIVLLGLMAVFVYYGRFTHLVGQRGPDSLAEFSFYGLAVLVIIAVLWLCLRTLPWPAHLLVLVELPILLHFAGGLLHYHGLRLYDVPLAGGSNVDFRFDKIVHFAVALIGSVVVGFLFRAFQIRLGPLEGFSIVFIVLGLCCIWELIEYLAVRTHPVTGVGGFFDRLYDNNMQDLMSNLLGALSYRLVPRSWRLRLEAGRGRVDGLGRTPDAVHGSHGGSGDEPA